MRAFQEGLDMDRSLRTLVLGAIAVACVLSPAWRGSSARAEDAGAKFDPSVRPEFSEPVVLASKDGVLEVTLTAHQATPVSIRWPCRSRTCWSLPMR